MSKQERVIVRARIPKELKDDAMLVLSELGISQSEVILDLFKYISQYGEVPFEKDEILIFKKK